MGSLLLRGGGGGGGTGSGTVGRGPEPQARLLPLRPIPPKIQLKSIHKANLYTTIVHFIFAQALSVIRLVMISEFLYQFILA